MNEKLFNLVKKLADSVVGNKKAIESILKINKELILKIEYLEKKIEDIYPTLN